MSLVPKRLCIFGCDPLVILYVPIHRFPHPVKHPDLFTSWVSVVGDKLKENDAMKIYKNKRICDHHFDSKDKISGRRLKQTAIPSVNLNRVQQSCSTFVETDHCYAHRQRESVESRPMPMMDITNLPGSSKFAADSTANPPTGSMDTTCLIVPEMSSVRTKRTKFDAVKTLEFLEDKTKKDCSRKVRQKENEIRRLRQKVKKFRLHIRQLKNSALTKKFDSLTRSMSESARLFTRMQYIEGQKKKKGHRFTLKEKILSLSLYKKSPKAYKLMCKHFTLPSRKVLKSLLAQIKINPGINEVIFEELKRTVSKMLPRDRLCTLIFDEMSITPHIFYNEHTDDLVGFENFGREKTSNFANHALVFMVKGIKKNFKQPVAYYFTQHLTTPRLKEIIKEVVTNVQATGLRIVATVCDQGSPNATSINQMVAETKAEYLRNNKPWRYDSMTINDTEIIPLFDVPHLLKGIRNNLLNKEMIYQHNNEIKNIKWEYFQKIFAADKSHGELRLLPKITREHVDPAKLKKMRVKNAAQLFSVSMAVAADNLIARGEVPNYCNDLIPFVLLVDKLFDSLNASSFSVPHGKKFRAAVRKNSPHHELWLEACQTLKTIKFMSKKNDGSLVEKKVPTVNNFIKTIEGFKALWQLLSKQYSFDALFTRNFNQDPLENFFGCIRSLGARNVAPNCMGFESAFKTILLNNFSSDHSVNANCEKDSNKCLQSLKFFLKNKVTCKAASESQSQNIVIDQPLEAMTEHNSTEDSGADQRNYVCGWALTKCLKNIVKGCKQCKKKLLGNSKNEKYRFIKAKEFEKGKQWLCYPSDCLVSCFQDIQTTTIAFLKSECYKPKIKERIIAFIELMTDFSFFDCKKHKEKLKQCFLNTTINIIIYSWCRTVNRILDGKIVYVGDDNIKKAAQLYYNTHKTIKK